VSRRAAEVPFAPPCAPPLDEATLEAAIAG
jgi:hypothetical protein